MSGKMQWEKTAVYIGLAGVTILAVRRAVLYLTTKCPSKMFMQGKTVIVTGGNCGLGYETALDLAHRQARVILACRDMTQAEKSAEKIRRATGNQDVVVKKLDLASLKSVREFCNDVKSNENKVDVLINNAGVMNCPFGLTEDGFETHMAVNHFGNFLLTNLMKESLLKSPSGRVVFVSSALHKYGSVNFDLLNTEAGYKNGKPYADSKLMNLLFAREFHKRAAQDGKVSVYSVHPGMAFTSLARHSIVFNKYFKIFCFPVFALCYSLFFLLVKTAREGCQTIVYCAVAEELEGLSDGYYGNCKKEAWGSKVSNSMEMVDSVWNLSAELTQFRG